MRNLSLHQFNQKIKKKILLAAAYTEKPLLVNIITSCRLKPITIFSHNFNPKTILEPIWVDEFNNTFTIKKKKIKIAFNTVKLPNITTDIFKNAKIEFIKQRSKAVCIGVSPNTTNFIMLFIGTDNYFRCYKYENSTLTICSPLMVGFKILQECCKFHDQDVQQVKIKSEFKHLKQMEWMIIKLPVSETKLVQIKNNKLKEYISQ